MKQPTNKPKIAFVHDWLVTWGGAEQVLSAMLEIWPGSPVYTLVYDSQGACRVFEERGSQIHTSFLQRIPGITRKYRSLLPLMPLAIEQFDLAQYDLVISSNFSVAKGVLTGANQLHISYVHSPVRYAWDLQHQYLKIAAYKGLKDWLARAVLHYIRLWDVRTSSGVDWFVANSRFVSRRIRKVYARDARVIHPPVDIQSFVPRMPKENYFLVVSRLVPYKRVDLIVKAFTRLSDRELIIIGDGPERKKICSLAGPNIRILGYQPFDVLKEYLEKARALVFAAEEDFGIVPVEAQASGVPVIAYRRGGAQETVIDGKTGIFFEEQSVDSLVNAILSFEKIENQFDVDVLRRNAERFSKERFQREMKNFVEQKWGEFQCGM